jgi:hypothetical protein
VYRLSDFESRELARVLDKSTFLCLAAEGNGLMKNFIIYIIMAINSRKMRWTKL